MWRLRKHIHVSWLIAMASLAICIGIMMSPLLQVTQVIWLVVACVSALFGFWKCRTYSFLFIIIAGALTGLYRGSIERAKLEPYDTIFGHEVIIKGTVDDDLTIGKNESVSLRVNVDTIDGHTVPGRLWISLAKKRDVRRSDSLIISGVLKKGFGSFAGSMYRVKLVNVERPQPGDVALQLRDWFSGKVKQVIPEPQASLGTGFLTGEHNALPSELSDAFKVAGLTHIVVASGYNLTILVRLARRLFSKVSRYLSVLSAGTMIIAFMAVTGNSPSMSRAGLVAGLSLLAWYYGRKFHPLVLLPLAAAVTLLVTPNYGWNDLGWQLSFASFAGVMIVAPLVQRYFFGEKKPGTLRQIVGETLCAQLATLPILIVAFGQFSNIALIANILILPLVPLAMLLTFIAGISVIVIPSLESVVGLPAQGLLSYMTSVSHYLASLPWAQTKIATSLGFGVVYYVALCLACLYMWRKTGYNLRDANVVE